MLLHAKDQEIMLPLGKLLWSIKCYLFNPFW